MLTLALLSFLLSSANAAIIPTAADQIGVNPVDVTETKTNWIGVDTAYLTQDPASYVGSIGPNTDMLTESAGTTKWIGVNTEYLTEAFVTSTVSGTATTTTNAVAVTNVGPTDPASGTPTGDGDFFMSPVLLNDIQTLADTFCGGGGKLRKRAGSSCSIDFLSRGGTLIDSWATAQGLKWAGTAYSAVVMAELAYLIEHNKPIPPKVHVFYKDYSSAKPTSISTAFIITLVPASKSASITSSASSASSASSSGASTPTSTVSAEATASSAAGCWLYTGTSYVDNDGENETYESQDGEGPDAKKRDLGHQALQSRNPRHRLLPRVGKTLTKLGSCSDPLVPGVPTNPNYYKPNQMMSLQIQPNLPSDQWWYVPVQDSSTGSTSGCSIAKIQHKGSKNGNITPPGTSNWPPPYGTPSGPKMSVDHVYEISLLATFFNQTFTDPSDARCNPFVKVFNKPDKTFGIMASRFQSLWNSGPNKQNKAFVGMDQNLNSIKGDLFNPGISGIQNTVDASSTGTWKKYSTAWVDRNLNLWNDIAMAVAYTNSPAVAKQFNIVNANIYNALQAFDEIQRCEAPNQKTSYADAYKKWMSGYLVGQSPLIAGKISELKSAITNANPSVLVDQNNQPNGYQKAIHALEAAYPNPSAYVFDQNALLTWPNSAPNPWPINKRDSQCVVSSSASVTPGPTPTCMADGAPWYSPTSWCDCNVGTASVSHFPTFAAMSGASVTDSKCAYTTLPSSTISPASTSAAPTNIPGQGGVPGCNYVIYPDEQACPYANYCNCGGTAAPLLTTTVAGGSTSLNCDYSTQPTANTCPTPTTTPPPPPSSTSTTPPPPPPPTQGPIACKAYEDRFSKCWNDIHADTVDAEAKVMVAQLPNGQMTSASRNITQLYRENARGTGQPAKGVQYMMNIGWIPGCNTYPAQSASHPMGGDATKSYIDLIRDTYYGCTGNNGLGGFTDVGCLRYGFYPSDIYGVFDSPPHPEKYWAADGDICGG